MSFFRTRLGRLLAPFALVLALVGASSGVATEPAQAATRTMTVYNKGKCPVNVGASSKSAKRLDPGKSRKISVNTKTGPVIALAGRDTLVVTDHGTNKNKKVTKAKRFHWKPIGYRKDGKNVRRTAGNGLCRIPDRAN